MAAASASPLANGPATPPPIAPATRTDTDKCGLTTGAEVAMTGYNLLTCKDGYKVLARFEPNEGLFRWVAMQQIADWLKKLGMDEYAQRFAENDIDFAILSDLTDQDLEKIGVTSLGHRRKLLRAIANLEKSTPAVACGCATCHTANGGHCRTPASHGDVLGPRWFDRTLRSDGSGRLARAHLGLSEMRR